MLHNQCKLLVVLFFSSLLIVGAHNAHWLSIDDYLDNDWECCLLELTNYLTKQQFTTKQLNDVQRNNWLPCSIRRQGKEDGQERFVEQLIVRGWKEESERLLDDLVWLASRQLVAINCDLQCMLYLSFPFLSIQILVYTFFFMMHFMRRRSQFNSVLNRAATCY